MANGATQAVENAARLSEIGFPEFTAKLITDTFNAITTSYLNQAAQYIGLVQAVSQTLQDYINNTADDISADEIGAFLVGIGGLNDDALNFLLGDSTAAASLNTTEVATINNAVALAPAAGASSAPASSGSLTNSKKQNIAEAIARRIANNKYDECGRSFRRWEWWRRSGQHVEVVWICFRLAAILQSSATASTRRSRDGL